MSNLESHWVNPDITHWVVLYINTNGYKCFMQCPLTIAYYCNDIRPVERFASRIYNVFAMFYVKNAGLYYIDFISDTRIRIRCISK